MKGAACSILVVATLAAPVPGHADGPGAPPDGAVHLELTGPDEALARLEPRLRELLSDIAPALQVIRGGDFDATDIFREAHPQARHATAWLAVRGGHVHVCVANAGRSRFVLRDLPVSVPLSELDRERAGHALHTALTTIIEGGPSALPRNEAELQLGAAQPPAPAAPPATSEPEPPAPAPTPMPVLTARAPSPAAPVREATTVGAVYEALRAGPGMLQGPGAVVATRWRLGRWHPELNLTAQYDLPTTTRTELADVVASGYSMRLGVSVPLVRFVHLGGALGIDRLSLRASNNLPVEVEPAEAPLPPGSLPPVRASSAHVVPSSPEVHTLGLARLSLRFGALDLGPLSLSALALFEVTHRPVEHDVAFRRKGYATYQPQAVYRAGRMRGGLAAEARWR